MSSKEFAPISIRIDTENGYFINNPKQIVSQPISSVNVEEILKQTICICSARSLPIRDLIDFSYKGGIQEAQVQTLSIFNGLINLVNEVLEQNEKGNDIRALLFLDKSARNGAYLFRLFWKELKDRKEIPEGVKLPEIRFINVGRDEDEKIRCKSAGALLKKTFNKNLVAKKVIVVDEFVNTGESLKRTMELTRGLFGIETKGFQLFTIMPLWVRRKEHNSKVLGVRDLNYTGFPKMFVEELEPEASIKLFNFFKKIDRNSYISLVDESNGSFDRFCVLSTKYGLNSDDAKDLWTIVQDNSLLVPNEKNLIKNSEDNIWDYITSAAGYISKPLGDVESTKKHRQYRQIFKVLTQKYMEKRDDLIQH